MDLIDRFKYVMKVYNESPSSFADKIGVQRSSISHILSGRNKPSLDFIQKIMEHYPKIDAQWLINGKQSNPKENEIGVREESYATKEVSQQTVLDNIKAENQDDVDSKEELKEDFVENKAKETSITKSSSKEIDKIIVFYTDSTFETFNR